MHLSGFFPELFSRNRVQDLGQAQSGQVYSEIRLENPDKSFKYFFLDIFQESRGFSESFMIDCDRASKLEVLLLRNLDQKFFFTFSFFGKTFFIFCRKKKFSHQKYQNSVEKYLFQTLSGKNWEIQKIPNDGQNLTLRINPDNSQPC